MFLPNRKEHEKKKSEQKLNRYFFVMLCTSLNKKNISDSYSNVFVVYEKLNEMVNNSTQKKEWKRPWNRNVHIQNNSNEGQKHK